MAEAYFKMKVRGFNIDKLLFEKFCINSSFGFFLDSNVKDFHNFRQICVKIYFFVLQILTVLWPKVTMEA